MKTATKLWFAMLPVAFTCITAFGQKNKGAAAEKTDASRFNWEKSKLIPKLKKLAITELTVNYKLTTTAKTIAQEKDTRKIAGARVTAYLEITDGELTQDDFQGITDHFYNYFQKKLKENGIDTVGWNDIVASDFYQKSGGDEGDKNDAKKEGGGNEWVVCTANKGKIIHSGMAGFAGGKGKRSVDFADQFGATAASFKVNVDFADVAVNLEISTIPRRDLFDGWYYPEVTKQKYTWGVHAQMQVGDPENKHYSMIWATKGWPEFLYQWSDIPVEGNYADAMTEDPSKARSGLAKQFAFRKELTPMLIQTTREKYIAAATLAVEKWADAFVARCVEMRKD
ncbi:MAG TPA: hypothetical protein VG738_16050 [Chitinophagaceae bacterium]|nr:hypothetical protein [Chitinophagaceae bacterium]